MLPRLNERLDRLEAVQAARTDGEAMPREVVGVWLHAMAIGLGGWPRPVSPDRPYAHDNLGDGFARALGYRDRADMDEKAEADSDDWRSRLRSTEDALAARYDAETASAPDERAFRVIVDVLDEVAAAKRRGVPVSHLERLERDLPHAVAHFRPAGTRDGTEARA